MTQTDDLVNKYKVNVLCCWLNINIFNCFLVKGYFKITLT